MGEAWSDWYAFDFLVKQGYVKDTSAPGDVLVGRYLTSGRNIVRTQPLDCPVGSKSRKCPGNHFSRRRGGYTYGDFGHVLPFPEVHADGEIWGETLWDLRTASGQRAHREHRHARDGVVARQPVLPRHAQRDHHRGHGQPPRSRREDDLAGVRTSGHGLLRGFDRRRRHQPGRGLLDAARPERAARRAEWTGDQRRHGQGHTERRDRIRRPRLGLPRELGDDDQREGPYRIGGIVAGTYPKVYVLGPGYDPLVPSAVSVSRRGTVKNWVLRRDWASRGGGGRITKTNENSGEFFGCGTAASSTSHRVPGGAHFSRHIDQHGNLATPVYAVIKLPTRVNISEIDVNPSGTCGDDPSALDRRLHRGDLAGRHDVDDGVERALRAGRPRPVRADQSDRGHDDGRAIRALHDEVDSGDRERRHVSVAQLVRLRVRRHRRVRGLREADARLISHGGIAGQRAARSRRRCRERGGGDRVARRVGQFGPAREGDRERAAEAVARARGVDGLDRGAGTAVGVPAAGTTSAPRAPMVTTTSRAVTVRARSASSAVERGAASTPARRASSHSFGTSTSTRSSSSDGRGRGGAGFSTTTPPACATAAVTASSGISSCTRTTAAEATSSTRTSDADTTPFAPGATTIRFSPVPSSTATVAVPVGASHATTCETSTPRSRRSETNRVPDESDPTRPTIATEDDNAAAAAAWLAPFPPGNDWTDVPTTVSPRPGRSATPTSRSRFRLPTTVTSPTKASFPSRRSRLRRRRCGTGRPASARRRAFPSSRRACRTCRRADVRHRA